jgi:hypothetical protein
MANDGAWFSTTNPGFGQFTDVDDLLHPQHAQPGDTLTETQYFGFNIPEENIYGFGYFWLHPNLEVVTSGVFVAQGIKRSHLQAELFDVRAYVDSKSVLTNDLHSYRMPNSYGVDVIEPGRKMRVFYEDTRAKNRIEFEANAVMPVAMRANNKHFEQTMKVDGELVLRGKSYRIDGFNVRDRSWGELRPEDAQLLPPMTWMTGAFGEGFSFNCNAFDDPELNPDWHGKMQLPTANSFNDGWVYRDGELIRVISASKITRRDPQTGRPIAHEIKMTDAHGRVYAIKGAITAGVPWSGWPNVVVQLFLTRWEWEGRVGWGDTQEVQWNDYTMLCTNTP